MERLNQDFFYQLGQSLGRLPSLPHEIPEDAAPDEKFVLWRLGLTANNFVRTLFGPPWDLHFSSNAFRQFADSLSVYGETIGLSVPGRAPTELSEAQARIDLLTKAVELQTILRTEINRMPIYFVPQQGIYGTEELILNAELVLPQEVRLKLSPMSLREVAEAGRCLAYGVPTACGFHMMRAVEDVLRYYCRTMPELTGTRGQAITLPEDRVPSWGDYTAFLDHYKDDDSIVETRALLLAMKRNERDVLAHPERVLTENEAYTLFQKGQAAITSMAERLPFIAPPGPPPPPPPPLPQVISNGDSAVDID